MKSARPPEGKPSARTASNSTASPLAWLIAAALLALLGEVTK